MKLPEINQFNEWKDYVSQWLNGTYEIDLENLNLDGVNFSTYLNLQKKDNSSPKRGIKLSDCVQTDITLNVKKAVMRDMFKLGSIFDFSSGATVSMLNFDPNIENMDAQQYWEALSSQMISEQMNDDLATYTLMDLFKNTSINGICPKVTLSLDNNFNPVAATCQMSATVFNTNTLQNEEIAIGYVDNLLAYNEQSLTYQDIIHSMRQINNYVRSNNFHIITAIDMKNKSSEGMKHIFIANQRLETHISEERDSTEKYLTMLAENQFSRNQAQEYTDAIEILKMREKYDGRTGITNTFVKVIQAMGDSVSGMIHQQFLPQNDVAKLHIMVEDSHELHRQMQGIHDGVTTIYVDNQDLKYKVQVESSAWMTELDDDNALKLMSGEDFDYQKMVSNIMKPNIKSIEIERVVLRDEQDQGQKVEVPIDVLKDLANDMLPKVNGQKMNFGATCLYETILHPISQQHMSEYQPVLDFTFDLQERYQERFPEQVSLVTNTNTNQYQLNG